MLFNVTLSTAVTIYRRRIVTVITDIGTDIILEDVVVAYFMLLRTEEKRENLTQNIRP
jgi:hypothetical protein